jgi:heme/copper-type cytochrome/quinol oxidase subunit 3
VNAVDAASDRAGRAAEVGMWLFTASIVMLMASLVSGYVLLRTGSETWPTPWLRHGVGALDDPWFRLICLLVAAVTAGAEARGLPRGPLRIARYPLPAAAFAGALFAGRTFAAAQLLVGAGHGPASHIAPATWLALNGVMAMLAAAGVGATVVVNLATPQPALRRRRSRLLCRYWTLLAVCFAVIVAGMYLV